MCTWLMQPAKRLKYSTPWEISFINWLVKVQVMDKSGIQKMLKLAPAEKYLSPITATAVYRSLITRGITLHNGMPVVWGLRTSLLTATRMSFSITAITKVSGLMTTGEHF